MFFVGTTRIHCLPTCLAYKWLRLMVDVFQMVLEAILCWHFDGTLWTLDLLLFFNGQPTTLLMFPQGSYTGVTFAAAFIFTLIWFLLAVYIEMALQRLGTWHFSPTDLTNEAILMKLYVLQRFFLRVNWLLHMSHLNTSPWCRPSCLVRSCFLVKLLVQPGYKHWNIPCCLIFLGLADGGEGSTSGCTFVSSSGCCSSGARRTIAGMSHGTVWVCIDLLLLSGNKASSGMKKLLMTSAGTWAGTHNETWHFLFLMFSTGGCRKMRKIFVCRCSVIYPHNMHYRCYRCCNKQTQLFM